MAEHESECTPATPDEMVGGDAETSDNDSSSASSPPGHPIDGTEAFPTLPSSMLAQPGAPGIDLPRRVPSLRTVSDPQNMTHMTASSSLSSTLNNARRPMASALPLDLMQKTRAFQQQRAGARPSLPTQPTGSPSNTPMGASRSPMAGMGGMNMGGPMAGGLPSNLKLPPGMGRPVIPGFRSAPSVPSTNKVMSLSERRAMKLASMGSPSPAGSPKMGAPRLSDMDAGEASKRPAINGEGRGSSLSDFKQYIDAEKGWITFEGAATITRNGVNFANGSTFSISLDEIEVLDELGKGNYGTVYKVRHAKSKVPRFGQGLSQFRRQDTSGSSESSTADTPSEASPPGGSAGRATSGVIMAMKELRLELEESKFTTILKELVILHECVSPYIIDFYGAFFQEGAVYMCIEYMDGGSIDKLYAGGIPEKALRHIAYATIMGLKTLKEDHNIIHRDVKPTNILVNTRGQVKICDFGVSGNLVASIAKTNIGCQSYMAPERISGGGMSAAGAVSGTYSVQSDIWSLGLTVIECAIGKYPYPPEASSTIFSQLSAIVEGDAPDLPTDGYPPAARDFVRSCLNKVPANRPSYPMLLMHPWLKSLSQPVTIAEDAEGEDAAAGDELADAAGNLSLDGERTVGADEDVAAWVRSVLERKKNDGTGNAAPTKPALHAAPLTRH